MKTMEETKPQKLAENTTIIQQKKKPRGRPFPKGVSGNPAGKPPGTRNFHTDFDEVVEEVAKMNNLSISDARKILIKKAYAEAKNGNFNYYKDIIDRYYGKAPDKIEHSGEINTGTTLPQEAIRIIEADLKKKKTGNEL